MTYTYASKTSDGVRHEAAMDAESRDAVFAALRTQGIRPIKVVAADGSKANGEVRGVRKRIAAAIAVVAALVVGIAAFYLGEYGAPGGRALPSNSAPRHQIYGDPVIVGAFERGDFVDALTNKADQMLAWFAQPGKLMCPKGVDPRRMAGEFAEVSRKSGEDAASPFWHRGSDPQCQFAPEDSREVRELKEIVNGMHEEMRDYLANGNGTPKSYWRRLLERTQQEMQIYERTRRELEKETDEAVWEKKNEALRRLGLRTIPNPKDA